MIGSPNIILTLWIEENIRGRGLLIDFSIAKGFMKMKIRGKRPTSRVLVNELFGKSLTRDKKYRCKNCNRRVLFGSQSSSFNQIMQQSLTNI